MKNRFFGRVTAKSFNARLSFLIIFFVILFLVLLGNIARLQILNFNEFSAQSKNNQISISSIKPVRGKIYDKNGILLAGNKLNYDLYLVPSLVKNIDKTIEIAEEFGNISEKEKNNLKKSFEGKRHYKSILIKANLSETEVNKISTLKPIHPEFNIENNWTRHYPYGVQTAHIIGYVGKISSSEKQRIDLAEYRGIDIIGKSGIEKVYEDRLRGKIGFIQSEKNAYGTSVRVLDMDKAVSGDDLFLSIDIRLQGYAESLLANRRGSIVILDNQTGSVLTMVSSPSYDANLFIGGISSEQYQKLLNNPDKPLLNRSINGQYPPGSIVKPFVGLAGIEHNAIDSHEEIYCPGWFKIPKIEERTYYGWKRTGHGKVDLKKAIVESCDIYFYELSLRMGINKMHNYLSHFSFGKTTGIDLQYESSGLLPSTDWKKRRFNQPWFLGESLIAGIGQGYMLSTPLQAAFSTAILANKGVAAKPKFLLATKKSDQQSPEYEQNPKEKYIEIPYEKEYKIVIEAMEDVVHSRKGTASHIGLGSTEKIAGKTGTAQVTKIKRDEQGEAMEGGINDHAWFTAFTPIVNPKITLAVIVENSGGGSSIAAPIAKKLIDRYYSFYPNSDK